MAPILPVPAATLLLVRDREALEVLMVERHAGLRFGPGAHVFPGGKLDAQDLDLDWRHEASGWESLASQDRALRICAIREAFEETGVLLAYDEDGPVGEAGSQAADLRQHVIDGELSFRAALQKLGFRLDLDDLTPFGRWITPKAQPIRFDAAFYIAAAPDQAAMCDGFETVSARWLNASAALRLADAGELKLMRPTQASLAILAASTDVASAKAAAQVRSVDASLSRG